MKFGRVLGTVVSTQKYEGLEGIKLLVVQPLDERLEPIGRAEVAADATAQAAPGELVFMVASREGAQALPETFVPVDLAITGIVDEVEVARSGRRTTPTARWHGVRAVEAPGPAEAQEGAADQRDATGSDPLNGADDRSDATGSDPREG